MSDGDRAGTGSGRPAGSAAGPASPAAGGGRRWEPAAAALAAVPVAGLTAAVAGRAGPLVRVDRAVTDAAHRLVLAHPVLLAATRAATWAGAPVVVDAVVAVVVVAVGRVQGRRAAGAVLAAGLASLVLRAGLKSVVHRPRPSWPHPVSSATGWSYPSGHAAGAAFLLVTVALLARRAWVTATATALVAAVAASRVLLGVHRPSDVVAGALLGAACALLGAAAAAPVRAAPARRGPGDPRRAG